MHIYLVFGYGIPKNILKDENMRTYVRIVFNIVYQRECGRKAAIIFCGGKTDCYKPYRRTEANELIRLFRTFSQRSFVKRATARWKLVPERRSLSTLENIINAKAIIGQKKLGSTRPHMFCEKTREHRVRAVAKQVFRKEPDVIAIDFDTSPNRYLDIRTLARKEHEELQHSLWALKSPQNLREHHELFQQKIAYFRRVGPRNHTQAIQTWWRQKLQEL